VPRGPSPPSASLVWSRLPRSGRARSLDDRRIVRAAMRVADGEGLGGLSMRRIADDVGAGAMSLYRHVAGKDDLLDLMLDAAFGEMELADGGSGGWRRDLAALARELRRVLRRHPWAAELVSSRPPLGPRYLDWFERCLAAVRTAGADMRAATRVIGTVSAYVAGVAAYEHGDREARRRHGLDEAQMRALVAPYLDGLLATGRYPNVADFVRDGTGDATDADFEFGLACVLDGLEARLARRSLSPRREASPRDRPTARRGGRRRTARRPEP
jgi:AcrR family transcriptional regulator